MSDTVTLTTTVSDLPQATSDYGDAANVSYNLVYEGANGAFGWDWSEGSAFPVSSIGTGTIEGFSDGMVGLRAGETVVVTVPPDKAYTTPGHNLYGKTLIFEITMLNFQPQP